MEYDNGDDENGDDEDDSLGIDDKWDTCIFPSDDVGVNRF